MLSKTIMSAWFGDRDLGDTAIKSAKHSEIPSQY